MPSIVCGDDDEFLRVLYKNALSGRYDDVRIVDSGEEVLAALRERPADLVIVDVNMSGITGLEVCQCIRREFHSVSVIIVSSEKTEEAITNGFFVGADDYIIKPFNQAELLAKATVALKKRTSDIPEILDVFPGTVFADRYEVIEKLGSGSFADVYHAKDITIKPPLEVALKVFKLPPEDLADQQFMALFLREAYGLSRLNNPNIVKLHNFGTEKVFYLAMEFLKGQTLQDRIDDSGPMTEEETHIVAFELVKVLRDFESMNIIHRDIKPINIMITDDGYLKLLDFGLSRGVDEKTVFSDDVFKGTPQYAAPESIFGDSNIDIKSDIYSLGATLYFVLSGVSPFSGDTPMQVIKNRMEQEVTPITAHVPGLNPQFADLIDRMLADDKEGRPGVADIIEIIKSVH